MNWTDFQPLADSIAAQSQQLATVLGDGSGAGAPVTASDGAKANINRIIAFGNTKDDIIEGLLEGFRSGFTKLTTTPNAYTPFKVVLQALSKEVAGINAYLASEGERVAPEFKTMVEMMLGEVLSAAIRRSGSAIPFSTPVSSTT